METLRSFFAKPDPRAQRRKCNALLRREGLKIDRHITDLNRAENTAKRDIIAASKRSEPPTGQAHTHNTYHTRQAQKDMKVLARELIRVRRQRGRLVTGKAQLESVRLQMDEAHSLRQIEGGLRTTTGMMKQVNASIRLPAFQQSMRDLSAELVRAGVIEESLDDMYVGEAEMDDDIAEADVEVDRVLADVLNTKFAKVASPPQEAAAAAADADADAAEPATATTAAEQAIADAEAEADSAQQAADEASLEQMRGHLESLKS